MQNMASAMKDAYDFTMKLRGRVPGPHKIWLANPKLSKTIVPTGYYFQKESTLSKPRSRSPPTSLTDSGGLPTRTTNMRRSAKSRVT